MLISGDPEQDIRQLRQMEIVFKHGIGFDSPKLFESMQGKVGLNWGGKLLLLELTQ